MALLAFDDAASIVDEGYQQTENGYGILGDGSMQVSVRTDMPGVTPAMWAWWFGWHGSDPRRYKLWHPRAHLSARWKDGDQDSGAGRRGAQRYVGRWSMISEYIGSTKLGAAIQFVEPAAMGLPDDSDDTVSICARLGSADAPVDAGWFVHQVRSTPGGSEMRSRFWMGGPHIAVRKAPEVASKAVRPIASKLIGVSESTARNLLVYCAQARPTAIQPSSRHPASSVLTVQEAKATSVSEKGPTSVSALHWHAWRLESSCVCCSIAPR